MADRHSPSCPISASLRSVLSTAASTLPTVLIALAALYLVQNTIELFSLDTQGTQRWHLTMQDTGDGPIVDPQNTQIVLGSATTLERAGYIKSVSTQDGHELWRVTLPAEDGFNQAPDSRARFSPGTALPSI